MWPGTEGKDFVQPAPDVAGKQSKRSNELWAIQPLARPVVSAVSQSTRMHTPTPRRSVTSIRFFSQPSKRCIPTNFGPFSSFDADGFTFVRRRKWLWWTRKGRGQPASPCCRRLAHAEPPRSHAARGARRRRRGGCQPCAAAPRRHAGGLRRARRAARRRCWRCIRTPPSGLRLRRLFPTAAARLPQRLTRRGQRRRTGPTPPVRTYFNNTIHTTLYTLIFV